MHYPLRAKASKFDLWVEFTLNDGPLMINEHEFVLTGREMSPILQWGTIVRGCDIGGLFEGDYVTDNGKNYILSYNRGLIGRNVENLKDILYINSNTKKVEDYNGPKISLETSPKSLKYMYKGISFVFRNICGLTERHDRLLINVNRGISIDPDGAQQYAGIRSNQKDLYFKKNQIYLNNGQIFVEGVNQTKEK